MALLKKSIDTVFIKDEILLRRPELVSGPSLSRRDAEINSA